MVNSHNERLEELLNEMSDILFPEDLGMRSVAVNSVGADGDTPLHLMVRRKDSEGAAILIAAGADVNAAGDMSETPLHVAIRNHDYVIVRLLLRAGAKSNMESEFGMTQRELAKSEGLAHWVS